MFHLNAKEKQMSAYVTIKNGTYRNFTIANRTFQLVADFKEGLFAPSNYLLKLIHAGGWGVQRINA